MEQQQINRREFLQSASVAGMAALSFGSTFKALAAETVTSAKMGIFICSVCGHVEFGSAPEVCPVCHSPRDKFHRNDTVFTDDEAKYKDAAAKHMPVVIAKKKSTLVPEAPSIAVETRIGKLLHPMEEAHHIQFIDGYIDDRYVSRLSLTLGTHPTAGINIKTPGNNVRIVALCNLHGYWQTETMVM
jgi:superoxide reductase